MNNKNAKLEAFSLKPYWPLIALVGVSFLSASAINWRLEGNMPMWMHYFMGIFLVFFALLKLFNLEQFADGFALYDILAKRSRGYAYAYPFIELLLGLLYLAFIFPVLIYLLTFFLLTFGSMGVILALRKGLKVNCACMGTVLNVPLSTVTLTEDLSMAIMALLLLLKAWAY